MKLTKMLASTRPQCRARRRLMRGALALGVCVPLLACGPIGDRRESTVVTSAARAAAGIRALGAPVASADASVTELATVADAGIATAHATRLNPPAVEERVDPAHYVNSLRYGWGDMAPAMEAFRVVASSRAWTAAAIDLWSPFVYDVIVKESAGCPNARGGDIYASGSCSDLLVQGQRPDSGFGQVTPVLYGPGGIVCQLEGLCSQRQIIDSAWNSMVALVSTLEQLGRFPWCDYQGATNLHLCDLIPRDARPKG
ncbi:MAG: hypothetical protein HZB15_01865 [Actinobacteria bacterium]|nr:hypothetical protein [Actinomycetota bacterium]